MRGHGDRSGRAPSPGGAVDAPPRETSTDIPTFVHEALVEFRRRNAIVIAWLRIGVDVAILSMLVFGSNPGSEGWWTAGLWIRSGFLAAAVAVLATLRRRWATPAVIASGAAVDFASLVVGGWRVMHLPGGGDTIAAGILLALAELVLLSGVLVLTERSLLILALAVSATVCAWVSTSGFPASFAITAVATVCSFALAVLWAGKRVFRLAMEQALQSYAARLFRTHRDELDATNRRLEVTNHELVEAQAQAETLTQLVVHDLKNPLAVVLTNVGLALESVERVPELGGVSEDLRIAKGEAQRLSAMIGDLLLVSRLERGELRGQLASVRIGEIVEAVARATRPQAGARRIRLGVEAPQDLTAWADPALLRRLLENLVSNALRFTPADGRIELGAYAEGESFRLAVRNSGPSIPPAMRSCLFEKYVTHGEGEPHNCGLGLYLCRLVAEAHGGGIALVERDGWNVSFEASLALAPEAGGAPSPVAGYWGALARMGRRRRPD
jgi:signal transduction histidine kinase